MAIYRRLVVIVCSYRHDVTEEQKELELDGVKGHKDATIDGWVYDVKVPQVWI